MTDEDGNIYKDWLAADEQNEYWVTCPECGAQWSWEFKQLKFDNSSPEMAQQTAMYCCKECGAMLSDAQHNRMNQQGFWKKVKSSGRQRVAFRMNVFASPFIRLGDIARQFEVSRKDKAQLIAEAQRFAAGIAREHNALGETIEGTVPLNLAIAGGSLVTITGLGAGDGVYVVDEVEHHLQERQSDLTLRKRLRGY